MTPRDCILCVDDDVEIRQFMARVLGRRFKVLTAGNADEALAIIRAEPVDLVITDVIMPGMDGHALISLLRQGPLTRGIPIIILTELPAPQDRINGLRAGADVYMTKPFPLVELLSAADRLLADRRDVHPMM